MAQVTKEQKSQLFKHALNSQMPSILPIVKFLSTTLAKSLIDGIYYINI
jgi:hypothetical protein